MLHIGHKIRQVMDSKPRCCTVTWLARQLNCCRENVYDIYHRSNIDVELLRRLSIILEHDFFKDISESLRDDVSGKNDS